MPLSNFHRLKTQSSKKKIIKVAFFFITIIIILLTSLGVKHYIDNRSKANFNIPQNINISNLSTASFSITWLTPNQKTSTLIMLGLSPDNLNQTFNDKRDSSNNPKSRNTHIVEIKNLSPNTTYYYRILSNNNTYPAKDQPPFKVKTLPIESQNLNTPIRVYGQVNTDPTDTIIGAYVIQEETECLPIFDIPNQGGNWYLDISNCINKKNLTPIKLSSNFKVKVILESTNGTAVLNTSADKLESPISLQAQSAIIDLTLTGPSLMKIEENANPNLIINNESLTPTPSITSHTQIVKPTPPNVNSTTLIVESNNPQETITPTLVSTDNNNTNSLNKIYNLTEPYQLPPPTLKHIKTNNQEVKLELIENQSAITTQIQRPTIGNVTENSYSIIWYTPTKQLTNLYYGINTANILLHDDRDTNDNRSNYLFHKVTLKHLNPDQEYTMTVNSHNFRFKTPKTLKNPPAFVNISGKVINSQAECFMKFQLTDQNKSKFSHYVINTVGPNSYSWNINIGSLRNYDLTDYWNLNHDSDVLLVDIFCYNGRSNIDTKHLEEKISDVINDNLVINMQ